MTDRRVSIFIYIVRFIMSGSNVCLFVLMFERFKFK